MECIDKNNVDELKRRWMEEGLVCIQNAFERHDDMRSLQVPVFEDPRLDSRRSHCSRNHLISQEMYDDTGVRDVYEKLHGYPSNKAYFLWSSERIRQAVREWDFIQI